MIDEEERKRFLEKLDKLIYDNLTMENLSVSFLADRMYMSQSKLFRRIKGATGAGGNEYIRNFRLEKAAEYLKDGANGNKEVSIGNVAFSCGFSSLSSFAKAFRNKYGMTATEFLSINDQV